ncbi:MAG: bifunctional (p)ppGpp synthetase/guanosine-3',5'-bis(diphosphate) 3'-pyrophosphohydrolase [Clostridiales Family XIII bacterium]|jgi:GTP pyrophosphokinase|nr:bifunctional (p)ppGpp synthetase/guanosine-3',5'-bis(diphosphate) 3'-pyrophosphohydrolase [Clostridiales Family XIII bacterium]
MDKQEVFLGELLDINPNIDIGLIEKAYKTAEEMHEGQLRKSGEAYLIHPVEVAKILADLGMDERTIVAGLLHDAVEDTPYSLKDVEKDFGAEVALLVGGVTKLGSLVFESREERQAENLRKMFLAMSKDIRVLIIKLADRLHNLRTINYMNEDQIVYKCRETLEIYAPLAGRLGIYAIKFELEDIALKYLDPTSYYELVDAVKIKRDERRTSIEKVIDEIKEALDEISVRYDITGRSKHFYSIYNKMKYQHKQLDEIFDLTAVRILVDTVKDCYTVLGMVHTMWKPIPGRFKDYIAMPKSNRYQSIHTTVIGDSGRPFEIQIRTRAMHRVAEYGIAAHWKYKEGATGDQEEVKLAWLRQTLEWNRDMNDPREFMETLKMDLFSNQVFVFTPKGDVMELPAGSTPLDFAFKIHTDIGAKCVGAKVNGKMVPIDYVLENGEIVDILTSNNAKGPSIDWLQIAKSSNARSKIRQWLKRQDKSQNIDKGKEMLEKAVKRKGYDTHDFIRNAWMGKIAKAMNFASVDDMYTSISYGGVLLSKVVGRLLDLYETETEKDAKRDDAALIDRTNKRNATVRKTPPGDVRVAGVDNLLIRLAKCCSPVPGDEIIGFITKGRGLTVHRKDCSNIAGLPEAERGRLMEVEWNAGDREGSYDAEIYIRSDDRKGLFSDISRRCVDMDVNISGVNLRTNSDSTVTILMTLSIANTNQMEKVLRMLRQIESVTEVYRARAL